MGRVHYDGVAAAAEQGACWDLAVTNQQRLHSSGVGIEGDVVDRSELVSCLGQRPFPDLLELAVGGGPFSVVGGWPEGAFVAHHDSIGAEAAQLSPFDQLRILAPSDDDGGDLAPLGVEEEWFTSPSTCALARLSTLRPAARRNESLIQAPVGSGTPPPPRPDPRGRRARTLR